VDWNATIRPSIEIDGRRLSPPPVWPSGVAETRTMLPARRSRRKTSGASLPSARTRFVAADSNAISLPSPETAGAPDAPLGAPSIATLTCSVFPARTSRR
jgi:hypothetical protein